MRAEDLRGLKVAALPGIVSRSITALGGSAVVVPAVRIYEVVSKGIVDAHAGLTYEAVASFNAGPYTRASTEIPGGLTSPTFSVFFNSAAWKKLPPRDQEAIMRVSGESLARLGRKWDEVEVDAVKAFDREGKRRVKASPEFVESLRRGLASLEDEWLADAAKRGVDGKAALAFYRRQVEAVLAEPPPAR
jgi:TRAP-type C4-dicarboxylate transport system substrate-binding protein